MAQAFYACDFISGACALCQAPVVLRRQAGEDTVRMPVPQEGINTQLFCEEIIYFCEFILKSVSTNSHKVSISLDKEFLILETFIDYYRFTCKCFSQASTKQIRYYLGSCFSNKFYILALCTSSICSCRSLLKKINQKYSSRLLTQI